MAILRVAQLGHPVLRQVARAVTPAELKTREFQRLCDDLLETMFEYDGAGLAAPQVHHSVRLVVLTLDDERGPEFMINPEIQVLSATTRKTWEGCLSVEGLRGRVERPDHIRVDFLNRKGKAQAYELIGFPAVVVQHECDHLDGVVYVDRVEPKTLSFIAEYRRYAQHDEDDLDDESPDDGAEAEA